MLLVGESTGGGGGESWVEAPGVLVERESEVGALAVADGGDGLVLMPRSAARWMEGLPLKG